MNNNLRIQHGVSRCKPFNIQVNGTPVIAYSGETIATVMLAAGYLVFRHTIISGEARGPFCGMGLCFDCLVTLNGQQNVRSCITFAQAGDEVERPVE